ncbi:MAG: MFS transporter [Gemmatimonadetes bacterium]|nr:MFS transporter [Gemmatimonadota bacterium]MDA1103286.1 MFS transporter [Gemmatimonadota bacterium]
MTETGSSTPAVNTSRLFLGSCVALIATSVAFATVGAVMLALKRDFVLTNEEVGWIGGAALWGFAISQLVFAPLADSLGMRTLLRFAFVGHLAGSSIMIFAGGFSSLFAGALVIAMANGLVEAACNPLVAALYPDNKTVKLNQFHVWFPGGVVLGGLAAFGLDFVGVTDWQIKIALILVPTLAYGFLILREPFPPTEGVDAGVSMGEMFKAAFTTPLMWVMLVAMAMTASVELGPNRWVPAVLQAGGIAGILVLVWINGLMAVLRYRAGAVVHRFSPTGLLLGSALVGGLGLFALSYAQGTALTFAAATVFAVGVCYFWPTMLGVVSERIPRSGALGLGLMGTVGMATVGLITAPQMGRIADEYAHGVLPVLETVQLFDRAERLLSDRTDDDAQASMAAIMVVARAYQTSPTLPSPATANALRTLIASDVDASLVAEAQSILGPADNYGGKISFLYVVPLCGILLLIFGGLYTRDRQTGGYRVESIEAAD